MVEVEPRLSQKQIAERLKMNVNTVKYYIRKMQEQEKIERIGSSRKGKWIAPLVCINCVQIIYYGLVGVPSIYSITPEMGHFNSLHN